VMLVLLPAAGAFVYWRVEYALDRGLDTELAQATAVISPLVGPDGTVTSPESADATGLGWQVLDADGQVLDSGGPAPDRRLVGSAGVETGTSDVGSMLPVSDAPYRVRISALSGTTGPAAYLLVGVRRDHRDEALRELLAQLTIAGLVALAIASAVGYVLAKLALTPVERYRQRADEITATESPGLRLDVPANRDDEVTRLGHTLNRMLAALQGSLDRERQFVQDASHELRTPLTLLTSRIQLMRRRARSVEEHEQALDELAVDVARLTELTEQLLELDTHRSTPEQVTDVAAAVRTVVEQWRQSAPDGVILTRLPDAPARARIGPHELERVLTNLLQNAATHGRPPVRVEVRRLGTHVELEVTDAGPGMPPELLAVATRRFHRAPEARSRPGAGLGLSIVDELVTAAGGELRLAPAAPGGLSVTVALPAAD
ncbi:MAG TPA: HAMP domain-containing sensor histidine kinase, partial [Nocardioides sp.]|nr:HAMP domain-containing sensor histidine kinase [Nocardioides sp.]